MNLRVNPLKLAAWLPALIGFGACQTITDLDTSVGPDTNRIGVKYLELSPPTQLVQLDSFSTTNTGRLLVGSFEDSEFGKISGTAYARFQLSSADPLVKADATLDSLVVSLELDYLAANAERINGETFEFHLLPPDQPIKNSVLYYGNSSLEKGESLGSGSLDVLREKDDTTYSIRLNDTWAEGILTRMINRDAIFKNSAEFNKEFPGIVISSAESNSSLLGINNENKSKSRLTLYFSSPGDTTSREYDIRFSGNGVRSFHQLDIENTGLATQEISNFYTPIDGGDRVLAMAGAGFGTLLDLNFIRRVLDTLPPNLINYADLILEDIEGIEGSNSSQTIRLLLTGNSGRFVPALNSNLPVSALNPPKGIYDFSRDPVAKDISGIVYFQPKRDTTHNTFSGPITRFVQAVADSSISETRVLILPINLGGSAQTLKLDKSDLRIRLYYTEPNL